MMQEKRAKERESGCCVRNDRSGCLQTLQEECSVSQQHFLKLGMNLINVALKSCSWELQDYQPGLFYTIEHSCCVGEVASTSQCSFSPRFVMAARSSLPSGPQVSHKELPRFYTHLYPTSTALCSNPELSFFCRICVEPASNFPHEWPTDITKWPVSVFTRLRRIKVRINRVHLQTSGCDLQICTKSDSRNHTNLPHIDCTITGRPCCMGTKGR